MFTKVKTECGEENEQVKSEKERVDIKESFIYKDRMYTSDYPDLPIASHHPVVMFEAQDRVWLGERSFPSAKPITAVHDRPARQ